MAVSLARLNTKKWVGYAKWNLLILLLFFLNVKLAIKIPAIALIYILQFNFRFGFSLKNSRLPLFYPLIIAIAVIALIFNKSFQHANYLLVFATGVMFWVLCILAIHQVKLAVEYGSLKVLHQTLLLFFAINAGISLLNLLAIIWETGALNPYLYQGQYQKYFIGTGDYIKGVTFDTSTTNAIINGIGVFYFLSQKKILMLLFCMVTLLLTGSNFVNIVLVLILFFLFVFKSDKDQKSAILICLMLLAVFLIKISPQNNLYVGQTLKNAFKKNQVAHVTQQIKKLPISLLPDSELTTEERKEKIATRYLDSLSTIQANKGAKAAPITGKPVIKNDEGRILLPQADINSATYQSIKVPQVAQQPLIQFIFKHKQVLPLSDSVVTPVVHPGKIIAMMQTLKFMTQNPGKLFAGTGMGNFSSKLAFRATGLGFAGGFPKKYIYINRDFIANHLDIYLSFFSKQTGYHSLTNSPFSVYDQLFAEYGFLGVAAFLIYYLGYFIKHYKVLTYGIPVLLLLIAILFIDYWFEQLSVLVLFELVLLINIKENSERGVLCPG